jgi:hypothetical protein
LLIDGVPKPFEDLVVDADGDSGFSRRNGDYGTSFALAEVVFFSSVLSVCRLLSGGSFSCRYDPEVLAPPSIDDYE